jgi:hypothetical protein
MSYIESKFHSYLTQIGPIFITIMGVFGNSFTFYILTRPKFKKEPVYRKYKNLFIDENLGVLVKIIKLSTLHFI